MFDRQFKHRRPADGDIASKPSVLGAVGIMVLWSFLCTGCIAAVSDMDVSPIAGSSAYDSANDPFYRKRPIYVTWIMIWNGSTERHWWKPTDYHGCRVLVDGSHQSINWNDAKHIDTYCESIHKAGIDVIAVDFTNGFRWEWQAKRVQKFCLENGMKFAVAFNPQNGSRMESGCQKIWESYAAPDTPFFASYLRKGGKPLVILYTTRKGYQNSIALKGTYRDRFSAVWASGEDSDKNKWGWQLEPHVGPVSSEVTMFVTGSVKFGSPNTQEDEWRKHLSWLDYGFIMASKAKPRYLIVGSFDDVHERNAWMVVDTAGAPQGLQMHDKTGAISRNTYYKRVEEWLNGSPSTAEGGLIPDGAYVVRCSNGKILGAEQNRRPISDIVLNPYRESLDDLVWFYHLGGNVYRMIKLNSGLALDSTESKIFLNWDCEAATQRWLLEEGDRGYRLLNKASGEALAYSRGRAITEPVDNTADSQRWSLLKQAVISGPQEDREQSPAGDSLKAAPEE